MKPIWLSLCVILLIAGCTTTDVERSTNAFSIPEKIDTVMLVQPDVDLSLLTASGMNEPRADWSAQAQLNLESGLKDILADKTKKVIVVDLESDLNAEDMQLVKLHNAVASAIFQHKYGAMRLPTKKDKFDYTLGAGTQRLKQAYGGADYAIFTIATGNYSSAGRILTQAALIYFGSGMQLGSQAIMASLVDLNSGDILWFNVASAGPAADMREAEGAKTFLPHSPKPCR